MKVSTFGLPCVVILALLSAAHPIRSAPHRRLLAAPGNGTRSHTSPSGPARHSDASAASQPASFSKCLTWCTCKSADCQAVGARLCYGCKRVDAILTQDYLLGMSHFESGFAPVTFDGKPATWAPDVPTRLRSGKDKSTAAALCAFYRERDTTMVYRFLKWVYCQYE